MTRDHVSFQRRPFLTPIWLTALAAVLALAFLIFAAWVWGTAGSTTVIIIRHAEKDLSVSVTDPPLNAAGRRAQPLLARRCLAMLASIRDTWMPFTYRRPFGIGKLPRPWRRS